MVILAFASLMFTASFTGDVIDWKPVSISFIALFALALLMPKAKAGTAYLIAVQDARSVLTTAMIAKYRETVPVMSFLRSFFQTDERMTKKVSIEVQRGTEKMSVDVVRGEKGKLNKRTRSTEKQILPPYFYERFAMNDTDLYDVAIASQTETSFAQLAEENAEMMIEMRSKIERRIEFMCWQIFETGVITLVNGDNIDYCRLADSKVDKGAGNYWTTNTVDPFVDLAAGCQFIREKGKATGQYYNAIFGQAALAALINNPFYTERNKMVVSPLDSVHPPIRTSAGGTLHGELTCGSYKIRVWTYTEVYDDPETGESTPYVKEDLVVVLPDAPKFKLAFAAVPQLMKGGEIPQKGAFLVTDFVDEDNEVHEGRIKSAPVPVPVAVDQIYTVKVVA